VNFARATLRPFRTLQGRVDRQMETMNERVGTLEAEVARLKGAAPDPETEE